MFYYSGDFFKVVSKVSLPIISDFFKTFSSPFTRTLWLICFITPFLIGVYSALQIHEFVSVPGKPFLTQEEENKIRLESYTTSFRVHSERLFPVAILWTTFGLKEDPLDWGVKYRRFYQITYSSLLPVIGVWFALLIAIRGYSDAKRDTQAISLITATPKPPEKNYLDESRDLVEIERAVARQIFTRSTMLLLAGIVMSFIGIAVFAFTTPQTEAELTTRSVFRDYIRPVSILFFIEAVAWFLLKQYRGVTEDFKAFHQNASWRANIHIALRKLDAKQTSSLEEQLLVTKALIEKEGSKILGAGETTEGLEYYKSSTTNPVIDTANNIINKVKSP